MENQKTAALQLQTKMYGDEYRDNGKNGIENKCRQRNGADSEGEWKGL